MKKALISLVFIMVAGAAQATQVFTWTDPVDGAVTTLTLPDNFTSGGLKPVYQGCFVDAVAPKRVLPTPLTGGGVTLEKAAALAIAQGLTYIGLEYGQEAWGGNTLPLQKAAADTECNIPCAAAAAEICGGSWRASVWKVK